MRTAFDHPGFELMKNRMSGFNGTTGSGYAETICSKTHILAQTYIERDKHTNMSHTIIDTHTVLSNHNRKQK